MQAREFARQFGAVIGVPDLLTRVTNLIAAGMIEQRGRGLRAYRLNEPDLALVMLALPPGAARTAAGLARQRAALVAEGNVTALEAMAALLRGEGLEAQHLVRLVELRTGGGEPTLEVRVVSQLPGGYGERPFRDMAWRGDDQAPITAVTTHAELRLPAAAVARAVELVASE